MSLITVQLDTVPNPRNTGLSKQIFSSFVASLMVGHCGLFSGWLSPMTLVLKGNDSPVGAMTKSEIGYLASAPNYAAMFVILLVGLGAKTFGRKFTMYAVGGVSVISGVILTFVHNKMWLYVGRVVGVTGMGGTTLASMYVSETVHDSIRGMLIGWCSVLFNVGVLASYTLGKLLSYQSFNAIFIVCPAVYLLLVFFLPESPHFLVEKSRMVEAERALSWFRGGDLSVVQSELEKILEARKNEVETLSISQILKTKSMRAAVVISLLVYGLQTLSGIQAIVNYAALIFEEAGSVLSPDDSSIVTACILLGASCLNVLVVDKLGRKPVLYVSLIGGAINLAILAVYLYLQMKGYTSDSLNWIPISTVSLFVLVYGVGLSSVPGMISNEVSPTSIRPIVGALVSVFAIALLTIVVQSFPFLDESIGLYSAFAFPAFFNCLGILVTWFMIPETKGKSFVEIENELAGR